MRIDKLWKNKLLKREKIYEKLHYHIETTTICNGNLYVRGWIYFEEYYSDRVTLVLEDRHKSKQCFETVLKRRDDIKCVIGPKLFGNCGIETQVRVGECEHPILKLQLNYGNNKMEIVSDCEIVMGQMISYVESAQQETQVCPDYKDEELPIELMHACAEREKTTDTYNIGILGDEWFHRGKKELKRALKGARKQYGKEHVCIYRIGNVLLADDNINQMGRFALSMLPNVILEKDIDTLLLPNSIHLSNSIKLKKAHSGKVAFFIDYYSYAARYRVEHFREKLQWQGIASDFYMLHEATGIDLSVYSDIVVYRCSDVDQVGALIKRAKAHGVYTYYDIDDFIFNYSAICDLDFLQDPEYKDFKQKTSAVNKSLSLFDYVIVSTNQLKNVVENTFPDKRVFVNRNSASLEMYLLSQEALNTKEIHHNSFTIGYFSGSPTHDSDFELVAPVLAKVMEQFLHVRLLVAGCMNIPECLSCYEDRICKQEFMDWRKLPACIADIDLNIQPLQDTFFHSCKSENKWMEAALVATPTVASSNAELEKIIRHGIDGILCKDRKQWEEAFIELIEEPQKARAIGQRAHDRVIKEYLTIQNPFDCFHIDEK